MNLIVLLLVLAGCAALGYWLVAVAWPLLRPSSDAEAAEPPPFQADPPWTEVLGLDAGAGRAEIEAAHRAKRAEHAPDRLARRDQASLRHAHQRIMQLDRAYAAAMRELGQGPQREDDGAG